MKKVETGCVVPKIELPQLPVTRPDEILSRVAAIHSAASVFAVAGYRLGERALHDLLGAGKRRKATPVATRAAMWNEAGNR